MLPRLESLLGIRQLPFQILAGLLLQGELMLELSLATLLVLLEVCQLLLKVLNFDFFLSAGLQNFGIDIFLMTL